MFLWQSLTPVFLNSSRTGSTSTLSTSHSPAKNDPKQSDNHSVASTQPVVPTIYPPRRRNIFSKSAPQRNVQWSKEVLATIPTNAAEDSDDGEDGFTLQELQQFQAEGKEDMEGKTEGFLRMASSNTWRPRKVEDLGELFEIED